MISGWFKGVGKGIGHTIGLDLAEVVTTQLHRIREMRGGALDDLATLFDELPELGPFTISRNIYLLQGNVAGAKDQDEILHKFVLI